MPKEKLLKILPAGLVDGSDELFRFLFRSHGGYPLMAELYLLNSQLFLSFLARLDSNKQRQYFSPNKVFARVKALEDEFVTYDVKLAEEN